MPLHTSILPNCPHHCTLQSFTLLLKFTYDNKYPHSVPLQLVCVTAAASPLGRPSSSLEWSSPDLHKLSAGSCMSSRGGLDWAHVDHIHMSRAAWGAYCLRASSLKPTELCSVRILSPAQAATHWCIATTWNQWVRVLYLHFNSYRLHDAVRMFGNNALDSNCISSQWLNVVFLQMSCKSCKFLKMHFVHLSLWVFLIAGGSSGSQGRVSVTGFPVCTEMAYFIWLVRICVFAFQSCHVCRWFQICYNLHFTRHKAEPGFNCLKHS